MSFLQQKEVALFGRNIFKDKHNRVIYYHPVLKTAYKIAPQNERTLKSLQARYLLVFTIFACFYIIIYQNLLLSILIGLAALVVFEMRLLNLLKNSTKLTLFKREQYINTLSNQLDNTDSTAILFRALLYLVLAVLLVIYLFIHPDLSKQLASQIVGGIVAVYALFHSFKLIVYFIHKHKK